MTGRRQWPRVPRSAPRVLAVAVVLAILVGCGGASGRSRVPLSRWLVVDSTRRRVTLTLQPGGRAPGGENFNGYSRGQVLVLIPRNWRVSVHCRNRTSASYHSCAIVSSSLSSTPAFSGAATRDPKAGVAPGHSASVSFLATRPGIYRIASLVDNDELYGMWEGFQIGGTKQPAVRLLHAVP